MRRLLAVLAMAIPVAGYFALPLTASADEPEAQGALTGAGGPATGLLGQIAPEASALGEEAAEPAASVASLPPGAQPAEATPGQQANPASAVVAGLPGATAADDAAPGVAIGLADSPATVPDTNQAPAVVPGPVLTKVEEQLPATNVLAGPGPLALPQIEPGPAAELPAVADVIEATGELAGHLVETGLATVDAVQAEPLPILGPIAGNGLLAPAVAGLSDELLGTTYDVLQTGSGHLEAADPALREVDEDASLGDLTTPLGEAIAPVPEPSPGNLGQPGPTRAARRPRRQVCRG